MNTKDINYKLDVSESSAKEIKRLTQILKVFTGEQPRQDGNVLKGKCDEYQFSRMVVEIDELKLSENCADDLLDSLVGETIKEVHYSEYDREFNVLHGDCVTLIMESGKTVILKHSGWRENSVISVSIK